MDRGWKGKVEVRTDGWWRNDQINGRRGIEKGQISRWKDGQKDRWRNARLAGWTNGQIVHRWMNKWMSRRSDIRKDDVAEECPTKDVHALTPETCDHVASRGWRGSDDVISEES